MKCRKCIWALVLATSAGCQGLSAGWPGRVCLTAEAEALAGRRAAPGMEARYGGVMRNAGAELRMQRLGQRLQAHNASALGEHTYQYRLLNTDEINAFSLPGGRVYITQELYGRLSTDELLAGVLAHEMAHIAAKDHFKPAAASSAEILDREMQADARAVQYLRAAGMPPNALAGVIRIIDDVQPRGWSKTRKDAIASAVAPVTSVILVSHVPD